MSDDNKVVVVGSVALDDVQTPFGRREVSLGGSAVYFSWACSLFSKVSMIGVIGDDFPDEHVRMLEERGIDISGLERVRGKTFHWRGRYDFDLNIAHTLDTQLNVFAEFSPKLLDYQREAKYLFLANIDPALQLDVVRQMKAPRIVAADTMNFWIDGKRDDLEKVIGEIDYLIINDAEARQLAGEGNLVTACRKILERGPEALVVKQGEYGVTMFHAGKGNKGMEIFSAPSVPLDSVIDPTGAGDSFAGAFMGYIASEKKVNDSVIRRAVIMGCVVASFTVEGFSLDRLKEVDEKSIRERFSRLKKISYFDDL
ncbi:MAG: sugar kinase [Elusimicrobia bacterium]|nr:sugar kinase [Elusimicrobiota bacterium]